MKLSKREINLLVVVFVIFASVLIYNYVYTPQRQKTIAIKQEIAQLNTEIDELNQKKEFIDKFKIEIKNIEEKIANDHKDFPDTWDNAEILYFIEDIIEELAIKKVTSLSDPVLDAESDNFVIDGIVGLDLTTDYKDIKELLLKLEEAKYFNEVTNFSMTKDDKTLSQNPEDEDEEDTEDTYSVSMNLSFYSRDLGLYITDYEFMESPLSKENIFD